MSASYDWATPRDAHAFVGYIQDGSGNPAGLVVRMVTHTHIPFTADDWHGSSQKRIMGTILGFPKLGFVSAPYSKKPAKASKYAAPKDPGFKPLPLLEAATTVQGEVTSVRMYNFNKANSNFDKGERDDTSVSVLSVGQALTYFISEFLYEKTVFPEGLTGFIPAFSVVEMQLNPSHNQSKGYGFKIARITPQAPTLYPYMGCGGALDRLHKSADAALEFVREQAKLCEPTCNNLEQARYGFYAPVDPTARVVDIREDIDFVRIECPPGSGNTPVPGAQCIDVTHEDLMRFANSPGDLLAARTLVDLAIAAGSLKMFVTFDDYYNKLESSLSQFRGVPLVDCASLLSPVQEGQLATDEPTVIFPVDWKVPHDPHLRSVAIRVTVVPVAQEEGAPTEDDEAKVYLPPPCPDMTLVSPACGFTKGYRVLVGNPGSEYADDDDAGAGEVYYVLEAYFNAAPNRAGAAGGGRGTTAYKRVKL
jgi:hypothetical protein